MNESLDLNILEICSKFYEFNNRSELTDFLIEKLNMIFPNNIFSINNEKKQHSILIDHNLFLYLNRQKELSQDEYYVLQHILKIFSEAYSKLNNFHINDNESLLYSFFNKTTSGIAVYKPEDNGNNFIIDYMNDASFKFSKTDPTIIGKLITDIFPGVEKLGLFDALKNVSRTGIPEHLPLKKYEDNRVVQYVENFVFKLPSGNIAAMFNDSSEKIEVMEKLEENEYKYQTLHENAGVGIGYYDSEGYVISYNNIAAKHLNNNSEFFKGKHISEIFEPQLAELYLKRLEYCLESDDINEYEDKIDLPSGNKWFISKYNKVKNSSGKIIGVQIISTEITKQKATESELLEHIKHFEIISNYTSDLIFLFDKNFNCIFVSKSIQNLTGYSIKEFKSFNFFERIHPDDLNRARIHFEKLKNDTDFVNLEFRLLTKENYNIYLETRAKVIRNDNNEIENIVTVASDITHKKDSERINQARIEILESYPNVNLKQLLTKMLDVIEKLTNSEIGFYHFIEEDKKQVILKSWSTKTMEKFCKVDKDLIDMEYPFENAGVWLDVIKSRKPVIHNDYIHLENKKGLPEGHASVIRELVVPLIRNNKIISIFGVGNKKTKYTQSDINKIQQLADVVWDLAERKRAEENLINSEEKFRALYNNAPLAYQSLNEDGTIRDVNPEWLRQLEYTREEVIGKNFSEFLHDEWVPHFELNFPEFKKRGSISNVQFKMKKKSGDFIFVSYEGCVGYYPDGKFRQTYCVFQNITYRRHAEEALIESEERLKLATKSAKIGIWEYNIILDHIIWNDLMFDIYDAEPTDSFIDFDFWADMLHPDDREKTVSLLNSAIEGKQSYDTTFRIITKKDKIKYIRAFGNVIVKNNKPQKMFGVNYEITKMITITKELEEKNEMIQNILDNLPIGIAINKIDEGDATYINDKFCEIYGWSRNELKSIATFFERVYPDTDYREKIVNMVMKDINSRDPKKMKWDNIIVTGKDGSHRTVNAVNIPIFDQNIMVSTVIDITKLKKIQEELIEAKEQAEESDRLKSAFLANMSHEIRTPMNGILGFADLLKEPDLSKDEEFEYLDIIKKSGERMLGIINDLIEISKIESGTIDVNYSNVDIVQIINDLYKFFKPEAEFKELELNLIHPEKFDCKYIKTDKTKITQILTNFIKNAIKYTNEGKIDISYRQVNEYVEFFVTDTGIGISDELKDKVFDRFWRADMKLSAKYEGAGLGLSISKAYVDMLGGQIKVDSKLNEGSTFMFSIKCELYKMQNSTEHLPTKNINLSENQKINILIAEDNPDSFYLFKKMLSKENFNIVHAENGQIAIDKVKEIPDIDLVLMDIKLPIVNGYEATHAIKRIRPELPVIAQTAFAMESDRRKAMESGFNDYIAKPIQKNLLIEKIFKVLNIE